MEPRHFQHMCQPAQPQPCPTPRALESSPTLSAARLFCTCRRTKLGGAGAGGAVSGRGASASGRTAAMSASASAAAAAMPADRGGMDCARAGPRAADCRAAAAAGCVS